MTYNYISEVTHNPQDLSEYMVKRVAERTTPKLRQTAKKDTYYKNRSYQIYKQIQLQSYAAHPIVEVSLSDSMELPYDNRYPAYEYQLFKNIPDDMFEIDLASEFLKILHYAFNVRYDTQILNVQFSGKDIVNITELAHCMLYQSAYSHEVSELMEYLDRIPNLSNAIRSRLKIEADKEECLRQIMDIIVENVTPLVREIMNMIYQPIYRQHIIDGVKLSIVSADNHRLIVKTGAETVRMKLLLRDKMYIVEGVKLDSDNNN